MFHTFCSQSLIPVKNLSLTFVYLDMFWEQQITNRVMGNSEFIVYVIVDLDTFREYILLLIIVLFFIFIIWISIVALFTISL